ncbi:MAG: cell division protein ZapE, partial [Pseudomonadota bacterium]
MTPLEAYQRDLANGFLPDTAQENVVKHTQRLYEELSKAPAPSEPAPSLWGKLSGRFKKEEKPASIKGLYLWGGVGRGKTHLVDTFYEALPFAEKQRIHFHRFMQQVHGELKTIKDTADPLNIVADRLLKDTRILCLDEFHVNDITDAMLLSGLLDALFHKDVALVSTSNIPPDDLYKGGLQRQRFLPAIAWIKENTEVINADGG